VQELLLLAETDPLWGERLVALVRLQATTQAALTGVTEQEELNELAALARALPPSQRPGRWLSCPSLAPSASGKWELAHWRAWLQSQSTGMHGRQNTEFPEQTSGQA
jgi:O-succinylbenzoic acid--CoA ligase